MKKSHIGWLIWFIAVLALVLFLTSGQEKRSRLTPSKIDGKYLLFMD